MKYFSSILVTSDYSYSLFALIFSFVLILVLAIVTTRLLAKSKIMGAGKNIKIIERVVISTDKQLLIVYLNNEYYFLSITKDSINLLDKLDGFDPLDKNNGGNNFSEILKGFKNNGK